VSGRALMRGLARLGHPVGVLCGTAIDAGPVEDPADFLAARGLPYAAGRAGEPPCLTLVDGGVPVTIYRRHLGPLRAPDRAEVHDFGRLLGAALARLRPDVLVTYGGDPLTLGVLAEARRMGIATAFLLHNFAYHDRGLFADVDAVVVPSRYSADHYRAALGLECVVLLNLIDLERVRVGDHQPKYLTFVNPSPEKGVYAFARVADELGRRRPDIPVLVVESRGTERTLAACGLDLVRHGTVRLLSQTSDPRRFWRVTKVLAMPSLFRESQGMAAVEAMANGIPVVASDRGALPETLGAAGVVLSLPERLTPATAAVPTADEVSHWIDALTRFWDDPGSYREHRRRAFAEARRWAADVLGPQYTRFFSGLSSPPPE